MPLLYLDHISQLLSIAVAMTHSLIPELWHRKIPIADIVHLVIDGLKLWKTTCFFKL